MSDNPPLVTILLGAEDPSHARLMEKNWRGAPILSIAKIPNGE
jgi:hypothetical protein